jgi:hypothetical protein
LKARTKLEKLNSENASIELMYVFIMDLLGQTTAAAKIFHNKFNEEYEMMMIVTRIFKIICIAFIFLLNGFFIYFLLLKSVSKGLLWQTQFLKMNLTTLLIEIFLFETIECLFLNYFIPESVNKDVYNAVYVLEIIAENLDNFILHQERQEIGLVSAATDLEFDSSNYLFLSKSLIHSRPNLIESFIIHSYQNHYPGMVCHSWKHYHQRKKIRRTIQKQREKIARERSLKSSVVDGINDDDSSTITAVVSRRASVQQRPSRRYSRYITAEINPLDLEEEKEGGEEEGNGEKNGSRTRHSAKKWLLVVINSIAAGIYYSLQTLGILPMFSQRIVIRVLQTSVLSGLTLLYYTSQKHTPYFAIFGGIVSVILLLTVIKNAYKQYEKDKSFHNNVLKKKIDDLKEKQNKEKNISSIADLWKSSGKEEFYEQQEKKQDDKDNEDELNKKLQLKKQLKREKKEAKRRKLKEQEEEIARTLLELDDIKYASPSFKPVAPVLQQDRNFLKSLDYLAALANADYTPVNHLASVYPENGLLSSASSLAPASQRSISRSVTTTTQVRKKPRMKNKTDFIHSLDDFFDDNNANNNNSNYNNNNYNNNYNNNNINNDSDDNNTIVDFFNSHNLYSIDDDYSVSQMSYSVDDNHSLLSAAKYYLHQSFAQEGDGNSADDNISYLTNLDTINEDNGSLCSCLDADSPEKPNKSMKEE